MKFFSKAFHIVSLAVLAMLVFLLPGCLGEEECDETTANLLRIGFYTRVPVTGLIQPILIDSISVYGVSRASSLIYDNSKRIRTIELPLKPMADSTGFVLIFPTNITDTIWVRHTYQLQFVSPACGFTVFNTLDEVNHTSRVIESVSIVQNFVSNTLEEHIKLFVNLNPDD